MLLAPVLRRAAHALASAAASAAPLHGLRVVEFAGLAPGPLAGMILADFGADVIRIDDAGRSQDPLVQMASRPLSRGKRSVVLDLKHAAQRSAAVRLVSASDVVIDPYRPGVLDRHGLGAEPMRALNPRLIYARLTGFARDGPDAHSAGHDINYLAAAGVLSLFARGAAPPLPPANLLGDFAAGSFGCVIGILLALVHRAASGRGQVVDASMVDLTSYLATFLHGMHQQGHWSLTPGANLIDGGAPHYDTYRCADGRFVAIGALEPKFSEALMRGLGIAPSAFDLARPADWPAARVALAAAFAQHDQAHWTRLFAGTNACVTAVAGLDEVRSSPSMAGKFARMADCGWLVPKPAPCLSGSPALDPAAQAAWPAVGAHTREVLRELGLTDSEIDAAAPATC